MLAIVKHPHQSALSNRAQHPFPFPLVQSPSLSLLKRPRNNRFPLGTSVQIIDQRTTPIIDFASASHLVSQLTLLSQLQSFSANGDVFLCRHFVGLMLLIDKALDNKERNTRDTSRKDEPPRHFAIK